MMLSSACAILFLLALTGCRVLAQCPSGEVLTFPERFQRAQIVLFGAETTVPACTEPDAGRCTRTRIRLNVYCVLKNGPGVRIPPTITIGNGTLTPCSATYFPHDPTAGVAPEMIVLVRYSATLQAFLWDEQTPGHSDALHFIDTLYPDIARACWTQSWTVPDSAVTGAYCPQLPVNASPVSLRFPSLRSSVSGYFCCADIRKFYKKDDVIVSHACDYVDNGVVWTQPTLVYGDTPCTENTYVTIVMAGAKSNTSHVKITWMQSDILCQNGQLLLDGNNVQHFVNYSVPLVKDEELYKVTIYEQPIGRLTQFTPEEFSSEDCIWCSFDLERFVTSYQLVKFDSIELNLRSDIYTSYLAYHDRGLTHADACHMFDSSLVVHNDFALCEPPPQIYSKPNSATIQQSKVDVMFTLMSMIYILRR